MTRPGLLPIPGTVALVLVVGCAIASSATLVAETRVACAFNQVSPAAAKSETLTFVEKGVAKAVKVLGKDWNEKDGALQCVGDGKNVGRLLAAKFIEAGDFHIRARLAIVKLDRSAASLRMGFSDAAIFGFEGGHGQMYVAGPFFGTDPESGKLGDPSQYIQDSKPFTVELVREGDQLQILIDGKQVRKQTVSTGRIGPFGFVPIRSTMRIEHFAATANFAPFGTLPPVPAAGVDGVSNITIHPNVTEMPDLKLGPFVRLSDGGILTAEERSAVVTYDDGRSWREYQVFRKNASFRIKPERVLMRLRSGVILLVFNNWAEEKINWDYRANKPRPEMHRPTYVVRSLDEGKTWTDPQQLYDGYCGALRDAIQTRNGSVVIMGQELLFDEGRNASRAYVSKDDGLTWTKAKHLDIGTERGDHSGTIEGTLEQLWDGRLWVLLRTYHGCFYECFSRDDGLTWTLPPTRSKILSTGSPGMLKRLRSGRLALFWSAIPNEGFKRREELSVAFSDDDGQTWTRPVVIARNPTGRVSYPYLFEYAPGVLWVTTMQGRFRGSLKEGDFFREAKGNAPLPPFYKSRQLSQADLVDGPREATPGLRYDRAARFDVALPVGSPMGEASVREHAIAWHPRKKKFYLVADVVPLNNPHHPNTYDTDLYLWSSPDLAAWTFHGIAVPRGTAGKSYDGHGVASPAGMAYRQGRLWVPFSARRTPQFTERSIGLAWSGDDPEQVHWTKSPAPISDLAGEDDDPAVVVLDGDDRLHLFHRTTAGGYHIVHTASATPTDIRSWSPAHRVTQPAADVRAQELTGVAYLGGRLHLFVIEHLRHGGLKIGHLVSRNAGSMFSYADTAHRFVDDQPPGLAYGGHLTPVVRDGKLIALSWTVVQAGKRYGIEGHPAQMASGDDSPLSSPKGTSPERK